MFNDELWRVAAESQPATFLKAQPLPEFPGFYDFVEADLNAEQMQQRFLQLLVIVARYYLDNGAKPHFCFPMNGANEMYVGFISLLAEYLSPKEFAAVRQNVKFIAKHKTSELKSNGKPVSEYLFDNQLDVEEGAVAVFVDEIVDSCETVVDAMQGYWEQLPIHIFALTSKTDTLQILADKNLQASIMRTFPHNEQAKDSWITAGGWLDGGVYPQSFSVEDIARIKVKERLCSRFIGFYPSEGMPELDWQQYEAFLDANMRTDISAETFTRLLDLELAYAANDTELQFKLMHDWVDTLDNEYQIRVEA